MPRSHIYSNLRSALSNRSSLVIPRQELYIMIVLVNIKTSMNKDKLLAISRKVAAGTATDAERLSLVESLNGQLDEIRDILNNAQQITTSI